MGVDFSYFAAEADGRAWAIERLDSGPVAGAASFDGFSVRGYDPPLAEAFGVVLSGDSWKSWKTDPRWDRVAPTEDDAEEEGGGPVVVALTDRLRDTLADSTRADLDVHVAGWAAQNLTDQGWQDVRLEDHAYFLGRLRTLAIRARHRGHGLYCHWHD